MIEIKQLQLLELFGGIGASTKALKKLGFKFKTIDYVEILQNRVKAYNAMNPYKFLTQDVRGYNLKPDILVHGSPCQSFSKVGLREGGEKGSETKSSLMWETVRIIKEMGEWRPKIVIWENVVGVLDKDMRSAFDEYLNDMGEFGYTNSFEILDARDFGIPHARRRVFCVSTLHNKKFNFNKLNRKEMIHIDDFLEYKKDDIIPEQYLITIPSMLNKIKEFQPIPTGTYKRQLDVIDDFCYTITERQDRCPNAGIIRLSKPQYRYLTERECWRLLGFSDNDFDLMLKVFPTKTGKRNATLYALAGNSIVVDVLEAVFNGLVEQGYIGEELLQYT